MNKAGLNIEKELIERLRLGDESAFEVIFQKTKGKLKGFLKIVLPKEEDEESLMQEIYFKIWLNRKTLKTDKNFETYLFAITRNMVIDIMRKRFHKQKYLEQLFSNLSTLQDYNRDAHAQLEYSDLERRIFESIEKLPERRKLIFKLNRIEGLTYKEISTKLDISENTVDTQMRKALSFLRLEMKYYKV